MIKDVVSIGDKLELIEQNRNNESNNMYVSQLLDFIEENKACISMPIKKGHIIPLSVGETYIIYCYTNKGLYQCSATIKERFKIKNMFVLIIEFQSVLEKIQRRQYYRIDCILDVKYHLVSEEEEQLINKIVKNKYIDSEEKQADIDKLDEFKQVWHEGTITDLSGGGARFNSGNPHVKDENIKLSLVLDSDMNGKQLLIPCKVISSTKLTNRNGFFEHRVKFTDIPKDDRETIIKFIFAEERRQRKRERGIGL